MVVSRHVCLNRLAKSAGLNPDDVSSALFDRGILIEDPDSELDGTTHKAARAVVREMLGARQIVRAIPAEPTTTISPAPRSGQLLGMLSVEDVLLIHERLCADFAQTADPIDPPGLRSMDLLASAVTRQESGFGNQLKYHEPVVNAATLLYGICSDHPFHNGNKRTSLVATLAHLDRNRLVLNATKQRELFRLMIAVADHTIVEGRVKIGRETETVYRRGDPDEEVAAIADWLRPRVVPVTRGESPITYRELRQVLVSFGFSLRPLRNQKIAIVRTEDVRGLFRTRQQEKTLMAIDWPGDGRDVSIGQIKHLRRTLNLCEEDGVTRDAFYSSGARIDNFINDYRQVLRKLASR
jgi:death-on-curing family protein